MMLPFQRENLSVQPPLSMPIFSTAKSQASLLLVYASEDSVRRSAKYYGWKETGTFEPCKQLHDRENVEKEDQ